MEKSSAILGVIACLFAAQPAHGYVPCSTLTGYSTVDAEASYTAGTPCPPGLARRADNFRR